MLRSFFIAAAILFAACGPPPIEALCDDLAVDHCEKCYACGEDGAILCGLPEGADIEACQSDLAASCSNQAATLEEPKKEVQTCDDSLEGLTCEALYEARALDLPGTTSECQYFL